MAAMQPANVPDPLKVKWYYRPGWVLLLLFMLLGPLGLPYLWKSPCFSRPMKIVLTIVELVLVAWLIGEAIRLFHFVQDQMRELDRIDTF